ncbi:MAG: hypothetical protein HKP61_03080, partial [Dactylosporangium sp.]|nr:hypothetical protein [Dactylosporangium sp.]NNJ59939.1 hypothetical protein [Dactylosporangium sp.]
GRLPRSMAWSNATVPGSVMRSVRHRLPRPVLRAPAREVDLGRLSVRGFERVLRLAWTIADFDGRDRPDLGDAAEALDLRNGAPS